ncbi:hypothetical protein [Legionella micdadei]|uniref:Uncharacterized protein n=1 Tax=Legionella micdadei TaxID=451 RepID=A0A098GGS5_LEGMI|nr:hypothetical protein [Legionella micdadei]ARG96908.1 hypothetical protein B6N58_04065 [Legionella micdadei]ARG99641.1 hypothetical protein B6V88_03980 [Legionella micdadei]KTD26593.1 hypothetical protein Lmic_2687 [Legionella micdadei]NSL17816.1 hypothetical protein [Legionella micdadei]CEG61688.1 conserved protein of unknown function [Legionella micdadei]
MLGDPRHQEKAKKTVNLLLFLNLALLPLYVMDVKTGLKLSLVLTAMVLCYFHELGKSRRPGGNLMHNVSSFFAPSVEADLYNAYRNVINGGDAANDAIFQLIFR